MSVACLQTPGDVVINHQARRKCSIVFEGSHRENHANPYVIPVKNRREAELLLLSLGEEAAVIMDAKALQQCNLLDWNGRSYAEILARIKWPREDTEEMMNIIEKIPFMPPFKDSFWETFGHGLGQERIAPEYVQKTQIANVLISKPYQWGNMFYFQGYSHTGEFGTDHASDHLEGILLYEVACQAGVAAAHLTGMPFSNEVIILEFIIHFKEFIDRDQPFFIRTIPFSNQRKGVGFCVFNVVQKGRSHTVGYLLGMVAK